MLITYIDINGLERERDRALTWTQPPDVSVGATSTTVLAADTTCKAIVLKNRSDALLNISIDGTAATATDGFPLDVGETLILNDIERDNTTLAIYAIDTTGAGSKNLRVLKGV